MFAELAVGKRVKITTRTKDDYLYRTSDTQDLTWSGTVVANDKWQNADTCKVILDRKLCPVSVIPLKWIIAVEYEDGSDATQTADRTVANKTFTVKGSKGDVYIVKQDGRKYSCTCKGFEFRKTCTHIKQIQEEQK